MSDQTGHRSETDDGYFTRTQTIPRFLRQLAGIPDRDDRDS